MKKSTAEFRELSLVELRLREQELREELFNLRVRHATGQLENPMLLKAVRANIARVKTFLLEKEGAGTK